jgi:hypothetical protein
MRWRGNVAAGSQTPLFLDHPVFVVEVKTVFGSRSGAMVGGGLCDL